MEFCNCRVRVAGSRDIEVPKRGISVVEVLVLMSIHKPSSVFDIEVTEDRDVSDKDLRNAMLEKYKVAREYIETTFPGVRPNLPQSFREIEVPAKYPETMPADSGDSKVPQPKTKAGKKGDTKKAGRKKAEGEKAADPGAGEGSTPDPGADVNPLD